MPNQPPILFQVFRLYGIHIYTLFILIATVSCKQKHEAPPLPDGAADVINPIVGTFNLSAIDTIEWSDIPIPGLEGLEKRDLALENIPKKFFELDNNDSIRGNLKTVGLDWKILENKDLDFGSWPTSNLGFRVKELLPPQISDAGNLSIDPSTTVGVRKVDKDFGIDGNVFGVFKDTDGMLWFGENNGIVKYDGSRLYSYGAEQGLAVNTVFSIFEDARGLFWIGEGNKVQIIDFNKNLVYELVCDFSLTLNYFISEDSKGRIWLTTNGVGFSIVDLDEMSVRQFTPKEGLVSNFSVQSTPSPDGTIWLHSAGGINIIDFDAGTNTVIDASVFGGEVGVTNSFKTNDGNYWIGTEVGLYIINSDKTSITFIGPENIRPEFHSLVGIQQDAQNHVWIGTAEGYLFDINIKNKSYRTYSLISGPNNVVYKIEVDNGQQIWASIVSGGLFSIDARGNQPSTLTPLNGLGDKNVWGTLQASDGTTWIGTYEGIDIINLEDKTIQHLGPENGLFSNRASGLYEDSTGRIWVYSNAQGMSIISPDKNIIYNFPANPYFNNSAPDYIQEISHNQYLIGGRNGSIFYLDLEKSEIKTFQIALPDISSRITEIIKDDENTYWISTRDNGLYHLDLASNVLSKASGSTLVDRNSIYSLALRDKELWLATFQGIQVIDVLSKQTYTLTTKHGLPAGDTYDLVRDGNTIYAGTSLGLAVITPIENTGNSLPNWRIHSIGRQQGMVHLDFGQNSMSIDDRGWLWAGVDSEALTVIKDVGLDAQTPRAFVTGVRIYDDELIFTPSTQSKYEFKTDTIWAVDGLSYRTDSNPNPVGSKLPNLRYDTTMGPYNMPVNLRLDPDLNFLSFSYSAFQFRDQDKLRYTYFLEGIDRTWSYENSNTTSESYRDLPPGDYIFKIAAKNVYSDWGEPAEFSFTILPHWWQTWWARALFVLILSVLIWSIIVYRSNWLKKENKLLEEKVNIRTQQLQDKIEQLKATQNQLVQSEKMASLGELTAGIAHEIQNPLNFVNNFSELNKELLEEMEEELGSGNLEEAKLIAADIKENENKIMHHGKRADSIVKGMLQHSRNNSGEKIPTDINALADEYLRLAYHGLRAKDKSFNATLETDFDKNLKKIPIVAQDIGRVILNIINNALYAVKEKQIKSNDINYIPTVKIITKKDKENVLIYIKDNGTGIPDHVRDKIFQPFFTTKSAGQGTGLGLSMSYDIIKAHGGDLIVESAGGDGQPTGQVGLPAVQAGTTFIIILPINQ